MRDRRIGLDLFNDVLHVLERHGFARGDNQHAGRALFLIGDLARIYEGSQDHPFGPGINQLPSLSAPPEPPGPDSRFAVTVRPATGRPRWPPWPPWISPPNTSAIAPRCAPTAPAQSCPTCQSRRQDAQAYDRLADRIIYVCHDAHARQLGHGRLGISADPGDRTADKEAGA